MKKLTKRIVTLSTGDEIAVYSNSPKPKSVVFLGIGQTDKSAHYVARNCDYSVAVAEGVPFQSRKLTRNPESAEAFGIDSVCRVFNVLETDAMTVVAESQASLGVVFALTQKELPVKSLLLLSPLGLNKKHMGNSPKQRKNELFRRSRLNWQLPSQSLRIAGNRWTLLSLLGSGLLAFKHFSSDFTNGISYDITQDLVKLNNKIPVKVFSGDKDSIFPYHEIKETLADTNIDVMKLPDASHINRGTPQGVSELNQVLSTIS